MISQEYPVVTGSSPCPLLAHPFLTLMPMGVMNTAPTPLLLFEHRAIRWGLPNNHYWEQTSNRPSSL